MPNKPVQADGGAMPATVSRRFFLSRIGGAAAASAIAAAPHAASASAPEESRELLALGEEFSTAFPALLASVDLVAEREPVFRRSAPVIPAEISGEEHERFPGWRYAELYRDPASPRNADMKTPSGRRLLVIPSYRLERIFEGENMPEHIQQFHRIALDFEVRTEAALQSSGMASALRAYHDAEGSLRRIVYAMSSVRARTTAGLAIKVRATGAYAGLGAEERLSASLWLANSMWSDLEGGEAL
jgi:hypothetical protein